MEPGSHELVIRHALARIPAGTLAGRLEAMLGGNDDEDKYTWPLVGWRTPAIGLTHTFRPGRRRGELFFPSAKARCEALFLRSTAEREPARAAHLLGRACHLLTDAAVPARTRGVWHYLGDPLERWIEAHLRLAATFPDVAIPAERAPGDLVERLAARAVLHPADTTRSLPGLVRRAVGRGVRLDDAEVEAQARALLPEAVAHVAALLLGYQAA